MVRRLRTVALSICLALTAAAVLPAADKIFFSRNFPGSDPAYFDVTVDRDGHAVYREAPDDDMPLEFDVKGEELDSLFQLADRLHRFQDEIASKRKTAFTGEKVLRYTTDSGESSEAKFVFTENDSAKELMNWFEKAGQTERHLIELERVEQFDRLGVNKALLHFQISFDNGRVVAPEQFLPILTKISEQEKIIHLARARAAALVERISGQTK